MSVTARLLYGSVIDMETQGTPEKIAAACRRLGWTPEEGVDLYALADALKLTDCAIGSWDGNERVVGAWLASGTEGYGEVTRTAPTDDEVAAVERLCAALELAPPKLCLVATRG